MLPGSRRLLETLAGSGDMLAISGDALVELGRSILPRFMAVHSKRDVSWPSSFWRSFAAAAWIPLSLVSSI